jgi:RNA polymerase sigma-70 factor (ECF subfamily)
MASPEDPKLVADISEALIRSARAGSAEALGKILETCRLYLMVIANAELDPELQAKFAASDLV